MATFVLVEHCIKRAVSGQCGRKKILNIYFLWPTSAVIGHFSHLTIIRFNMCFTCWRPDLKQKAHKKAKSKDGCSTGLTENYQGGYQALIVDFSCLKRICNQILQRTEFIYTHNLETVYKKKVCHCISMFWLFCCTLQWSVYKWGPCGPNNRLHEQQGRKEQMVPSK